MAKMFNYLILISVLMIIFNMAGLAKNTGTVLGDLNMTSPTSVSSFEDTTFFDKFKAEISIIALFTFAGIIIGSLTGSNNVQAIMTVSSAGIASGILVAFIYDMVSVVQILSSEYPLMGYIAIVIVAPLIIAYMVAVWDWIRGGVD